MQPESTQPTPPSVAPSLRYVVQEGPPTWIVYDTVAGQRVGYFPLESESDARRAAARLNRSHSDHPTSY